MDSAFCQEDCGQSNFSCDSPLATFELFTELPVEIRLKIWRTVATAGRIVRLKYNEHSEQFISTQPPLLSVSSEAREEGLKHYTLAFGTPVNDPQIFINFLSDIIFIDSGRGGAPDEDIRQFYLAMSTKDAERVMHLAVGIYGKEFDDLGPSWLYLRKFSSANLVSLVIHDPRCDSAAHGMEVEIRSIRNGDVETWKNAKIAARKLRRMLYQLQRGSSLSEGNRVATRLSIVSALKGSYFCCAKSSARHNQ